jgi:hypothetical protein
MNRPYLLRFAVEQSSHPADEIADRCEYDRERDIVVLKGTRTPAVLDTSARPLVTKKKDIEKGEDQKDTWM